MICLLTAILARLFAVFDETFACRYFQLVQFACDVIFCLSLMCHIFKWIVQHSSK